MTWQVPEGGEYRIETFNLKGTPLNRTHATAGDGLLRLNIAASAMDEVRIVVSRREEKNGS
ncbi:MAG TPA: hypothetical protein HPQ00_12960 [Magnetococcales bacterium]|nr:hypothetical protein [Magnetococcales bacterium]